MKEKRQSVWLDTWTQLQALRVVRLQRLGKFAEPEDLGVGHFSAILQRIARQLLALAESRESDDESAAIMIEMAWEEYLRNEWAVTLTPAFPLSAFSNVTVLQRSWIAAEKTIAEEASLRGVR